MPEKTSDNLGLVAVAVRSAPCRRLWGAPFPFEQFAGTGTPAASMGYIVPYASGLSRPQTILTGMTTTMRLPNRVRCGKGDAAMRRAVAFGVSVVLIPAVVVPAAGGENYLFNGGFELATNPGLPDGWSPVPNWGLRYLPEFSRPDHVLGGFRLVGDNPHSGRRALRISRRPDGEPGRVFSCAIRPPVFRATEEPLYLTAWCRGDHGSRVWVQARNANGNTISSGDFLVGPTWRRAIMKMPREPLMSVAFATPEDGEAVFLDDVTVTYGLPEEVRRLPRDESEIGREPDRLSTLAPRPGEQLPAKRPRRFVCAAGLGKDPAPAVLAAVADIEANAVVVRHPYLSDGLLEGAARLGLRIVVWVRGARPAMPLFRTYSSRPEIAAWMVVDEPRDPTAGWASRILAPYREADPSAKVFINHYWDQPKREDFPDLAGDILSADEYPVPRRPISSLIPWYGSLGRHSLATGRPAWAWVQVCGYHHDTTREPTPREWRVMAYTAIASGLRGMMYFENRPLSGSLWQMMERVHHELAAIEPFLFEPAKATDVHLSPVPEEGEPTVLCLARGLQNQRLLIVVNTAMDAASVKLSCPELPADDRLPGRFGTPPVGCENGAADLRVGPLSVSVWTW